MPDNPGIGLPDVQNYEWALLNNKAGTTLGVGMIGFAGLSALGTPGAIPIFTSPTTLASSVMVDDGSAFNLSGRGLWLNGNPNIVWGAPVDIFLYDTTTVDKNGAITVWLVGDPAQDNLQFWAWGSETDSKSGNSHVISKLGGGYMVVVHGGSGTLGQEVGFNCGVGNTSTGTVTEAEGLLISGAYNSGGGTITKNYGLRIEAQTVGTTAYDQWNGPAITSFNSDLQTNWVGFYGQNFFGAINPPQQYAGFFVAQSSTGTASGLAALAYTSVNTHSPTAIEAYATATHTTGTMSFVTSVFAGSTNLSTGTVTDLIAIQATNNNNSGGGTVTNSYGLYINNQTAGTNNYAIFTNSGPCRFGSEIRVGGDVGGATSMTTITNGTNATVTNAYIVKGGQAANTVNTGWLKLYVGTNAVWVPYWQNATP